MTLITTLAEYQRNDDSCGLDITLPVVQKVEPEDKWCWVPQLKTIGDIPDDTYMIHIEELITNGVNVILYFREKSSAFIGVG